MSQDRVIHLLSDEEISYILSGLRLLGKEYLEQDNDEDMSLVNQLYDKVYIAEDMGVIGHERI